MQGERRKGTSARVSRSLSFSISIGKVSEEEILVLSERFQQKITCSCPKAYRRERGCMTPQGKRSVWDVREDFRKRGSAPWKGLLSLGKRLRTLLSKARGGGQLSTIEGKKLRRFRDTSFYSRKALRREGRLSGTNDKKITHLKDSSGGDDFEEEKKAGQGGEK